jgi:hypothetical protein
MLLIGVVLSLSLPLSGQELEREFRFCIAPSLALGYRCYSFDVISLGVVAHESNQPVWLVDLGLVRAGVCLTPLILTNSPLGWRLLGSSIVPYVSAGIEVYTPTSPFPVWYYWEIGTYLVWGRFFVHLGTGEPSWLNIGFGLMF